MICLIVNLLHGLGEVSLQLVVGVRGLVDALLEGRVGVVPRAPHVVGALRHHVVHIWSQTLRRRTSTCSARSDQFQSHPTFTRITHFLTRRFQLRQHFTSSFYACRSQRRKKDSQLKQLFALAGSASINAAHKHVDEIDPKFQLYQHFTSSFFLRKFFFCPYSLCIWVF